MSSPHTQAVLGNPTAGLWQSGSPVLEMHSLHFCVGLKILEVKLKREKLHKNWPVMTLYK
jgi:hypothetical protein